MTLLNNLSSGDTLHNRRRRLRKAVRFYIAKRDCHCPPSIKLVAKNHNVAFTTLRDRLAKRFARESKLLNKFANVHQTEFADKDKSVEHLEKKDRLERAIRYYGSTRSRNRPPSIRHIADVYKTSKTSLLLLITKRFPKNHSLLRLDKSSTLDCAADQYTTPDFRTVTITPPSISNSGADAYESSYSDPTFGDLNITLEKRVTVTLSARMYLARYFTDLCEMELFATGKVVRPNLGNLSLSAHMVSEPGIHHQHMSTIRSGDRILKFSTFRTAEWAIAKVWGNKGKFCSVDVTEAERRPIIVRLNSDTKIVCRKRKSDQSMEVKSLYEEYQKVRIRTQNNWHLKSFNKEDDFFRQRMSTEFGYSTFPGGSEIQKRCTAEKIPYLLKSMTTAKEFYHKFMANMITLAWKETCCAFPVESAAMLSAVPAQFRLENTGFTKLTIAVNNPTPLHYDNNNYGVTHLVTYDVNDNLQEGFDGNGHHVLVGNDFVSGMFVNTNRQGTVIIGDYRRILHANCAIFPTGIDEHDKDKTRLILTCYCSQSLVDLVRRG
jgi:hypothetical protein